MSQLEMLAGVVVVAQAECDIPEVVMGGGVIGLQLDDPPIVLLGELELARPVIGHPCLQQRRYSVEMIRVHAWKFREWLSFTQAGVRHRPGPPTARAGLWRHGPRLAFPAGRNYRMLTVSRQDGGFKPPSCLSFWPQFAGLTAGQD